MLSLLSAAAASADTLWTMTFDTSDYTNSISQIGLVTSLGTEFSEAATLSLTTTSIVTSGKYGTDTDVIVPNHVVNGTNGNEWSITLTFKNTTANDMLISGVTANLFACNASGNIQGGDRHANLSGSLGDATLTSVDIATTTTGGERLATKTFTLPEADAVTLASQDSLSLTFRVKGASSGADQSYWGISSLSFNGTATSPTTGNIPEPATSALSLLALAGLAARRRRK